MAKIKPKDKPHYVNNREFSYAVVDYCTIIKEAKAAEKRLPVVTDYIAKCFLRIAEGLSHKSNFVRYTYREEMVMDAVENCLKAIENYNIEAATRTGNPNAFAYFGVANNVAQHFVDTLKSRIDSIKVKDTAIKEIAKQERKKMKSKAVANSGDSDLSEILT